MIEFYEVLMVSGTWRIVAGDYELTPIYGSFRAAFGRACDLAGWTPQDLDVVGDPLAVAQEILT